MCSYVTNLSRTAAALPGCTDGAVCRIVTCGARNPKRVERSPTFVWGIAMPDSASETVVSSENNATSPPSALTVPESGLMSKLRSLTLRSKLLLMLLPTSLLSMGTVAVLGYESGKQALTEQATAQVLSVRASKKQQIESYFRTMRDTFAVFGDDVAVVSATSLFKDGYNQLGRVRLPDERRRKLEDYYRKSFLPALAKRAPRDPILYRKCFATKRQASSRRKLSSSPKTRARQIALVSSIIQSATPIPLRTSPITPGFAMSRSG